MVVNIVRNLSSLGYSEYEGRAYVALLKSHPATAYEVAKVSGIPTSKVYEVLARLCDKDMAMEIVDAARRRYVPMEPAELLQGLRDTTATAIDALAEGFAALRSGQEVSYVWNLDAYTPFMDRARRLVRKARDRILVSTWPEEAKVLEDPLAEAARRGCKCALVHFGSDAPDVGQVYRHPIEDTIYAEKGGRGFVLVVDSAECLMGTIADGGVLGAWSRNRGFVTLAEDYVKHDVYVMKIVERFDKELQNTFGPGYVRLRDVFTDEEAEA